MAGMSIGIMSVYFGKFPAYFSVWLESCRRNPTIDFIVVTDQDICCDIANVRIVKSTLDTFKAQASAMLGFEVIIDTPFKLCDYKPAYGVIFETLLKPYDYWGHCDIDVIWGDLRTFFDRYHIEKYDKFLPLGHLSLYRNTFENNRRFMNQVEGLSNYRKIFQSKQNYLFDELALIQIYQEKFSFFDKIIFADIWPSKRRYTMCTQLKYYPSIYQELEKRYNPINFKEQIFLWIDGKIYQYYIEDNKIGRREYIYIHMQKRPWKLDGEFSNQMYISQNRVCACADGYLDIPKLINSYNPYSASQDYLDDICEFVEHCWSYFKRKIIKTEQQRIIVESK